MKGRITGNATTNDLEYKHTHTIGIQTHARNPEHTTTHDLEHTHRKYMTRSTWKIEDQERPAPKNQERPGPEERSTQNRRTRQQPKNERHHKPKNERHPLSRNRRISNTRGRSVVVLAREHGEGRRGYCCWKGRGLLLFRNRGLLLCGSDWEGRPFYCKGERGVWCWRRRKVKKEEALL